MATKQPLELPIRATILSFTPADGVGSIELEDGRQMRFGASACIDFRPEVGLACWLISTKEFIGGGAPRAKVLNLTGEVQDDPATAALSARAAEAALEDEVGALVLRFAGGATHIDWGTLKQAERKELADAIMELRSRRGLPEDLFEPLVEVDPSAFHPYLKELDPRIPPESLAYLFAPLSELQHLVDRLSAPNRKRPSLIGRTMRFLQAQREADSAQSSRGAAMCGLARSFSELAWKIVEDAYTPDEQTDLVNAGFTMTANGLKSLWSPSALELLAADDTSDSNEDVVATLWGEAKNQCRGCGDQMARVASLNVVDAGLGERREDGLLEIATCRRCLRSGVNPYFVCLLAPDRSINVEPTYEPDEDDLDNYPSASPHTGRPSPSYLNDILPVRTRIGGAPRFIKGADWVVCPSCDNYMHFVAQFPDPPETYWDGDESALYAFLCRPCGIVGTCMGRY